MIQSDHKFAHVMTAQLLGYVQNCGVIESASFMQDMHIFIRFRSWAFKLFMKWVIDIRGPSHARFVSL